MVPMIANGKSSRFSISDLAPGQYSVHVRATSAAGVSAPSNEVSVTVTGVTMGRVAHNVRATVVGHAVRVMWDRPAELADLAAYALEAGTPAGRSDLGSVTTTLQSISLPFVPDGTYFIRVRTIFANGPSPWSDEVMLAVGQTHRHPARCRACPAALRHTQSARC